MQPRFISKLPADILNQLHAKLVDSDFSGYAEHASWLASLGYNASSSAIHRYANDFRYLILRETDPVFYDTQVFQRVAAMQVAANLATDESELMALVDRVLSWMHDV